MRTTILSLFSLYLIQLTQNNVFYSTYCEKCRSLCYRKTFVPLYTRQKWPLINNFHPWHSYFPLYIISQSSYLTQDLVQSAVVFCIWVFLGCVLPDSCSRASSDWIWTAGELLLCRCSLSFKPVFCQMDSGHWCVERWTSVTSIRRCFCLFPATFIHSFTSYQGLFFLSLLLRASGVWCCHSKKRAQQNILLGGHQNKH